MDQKPALWIALLLAAVVLAAIAGAGVMTLGANNTEKTLMPGTSQGSGADSRDLFPDKVYPEYATGYSVEYHGTYKVVQIHDPWGRSSQNHTYLLVQRGETVPEGYPGARVFTIPVTSVITLSSVHVPNIQELNETLSVKGHNQIQLLHGEEIRQLAREGKIAEVGSGSLGMNNLLRTETMIELEPDVVFCTANGNAEYDKQPKLLEAGLNPAITAEWMESHPLGRSEWIKYFSLFYNKEKTANEVFGRISSNYTAIADIAKNATSKPTLFSGIEYQGTWSAPAGGSYVAILFHDAGGDYILGNNGGYGSNTFDFESVYDQAQGADFWINTGNGVSIEEILALDSRYAKFRAFQLGNVYQFNARVNEFGGNDYWQSGVVHPDIILADLVKILHPELLPDHDFYYYRHLATNQTDRVLRIEET